MHNNGTIKGIILEQKLQEYIKQILGISLGFQSFMPGGLPFYVSSLYTFKTTELEKRKLLLCFISAPEIPTPSQLMDHEAVLRQASKLDVVFVLSRSPSWERKRLIEGKVPFIVPGYQLYLPMLLIDLREHFPAERKKSDRLSIPAQFVLLSNLNHASIEGLSIRELAGKLGYSAISMSRAVDELINLDLAETNPGKKKPLRFLHDPGKLWGASLPFLRSPVKATCFLEYDSKLPAWPKAGLAALAVLGNINDDSRKCLAVTQLQLKPFVEKGLVHTQAMGDRDIAIEIWTYDPSRLCNGDTVDPFSLYLSMRDENDERVRKALADLIKGAF